MNTRIEEIKQEINRLKKQETDEINYKNIDNTILAYVAGLLDGEGSIGISLKKKGTVYIRKKGYTRKTDKYSLHIQIGNTNRKVIEWLKDIFGGQFQIVKHKDCRGEKFFAWHLYTNKAYNLLNCILPYMKIKRKQCELAVEFQKEIIKFKGCKHIPKLSLSKRKTIKEYISFLNKNGNLLELEN